MYLRYLKIFPTNPEKASFYSRFIRAQSHFKSYPYPSFSSEPLAPQFNNVDNNSHVFTLFEDLIKLHICFHCFLIESFHNFYSSIMFVHRGEMFS